jgi:hypothetical protein
MRLSELRANGPRDILPPSVKIEGVCTERPLEGEMILSAINRAARATPHQHDGAAVDQFFEARMMLRIRRVQRDR